MKKLILLAVVFTLILSVFYGCEYDVDEGMQINEQLVYTLVGEGEESYYIVGTCEKLADIGLSESSAMRLDFEEKSKQLGVYGGKDKTVTVPASHEGKPVRAVGAFAFYMCEAVEIILPESIELIGESAFRNCTNLKSVTVGNEENGSALTEISDKAFSGSEKVSCIYLYGSSVPTVSTLNPQQENNPFYTTWYPAVVVPQAMVDVYKMDDVWGEYQDYIASDSGVYVNGLIVEGGVLIKYVGEQTTVTITEIVKTIGKYSFKNSTVAEVTITPQVEEIGRQAFCDCKELVAVHVGDDSLLSIIGNNAFDGCIKLKTATLPPMMRIVKDEAFSDCTSLDTLYILGTSITNVFINAFENCTSLQDVFFAGSELDFEKISFSKGNDSILNAVKNYNFNKQ